jgi:hypothetical protein
MSSERDRRRSPGRGVRWRYFVQFSLRSLLIFMTGAAIACWWFLQPQIREEPLGGTALRVRRQIRLVKTDGTVPQLRLGQIEAINGQQFLVVNAGNWRVLDPKSNLLVDGRYKDGEAHGQWTIYHVNGRKAVEGMMVGGEKVGRWRSWNEDGLLVSDVEHVGRK